MKSYQKKESKVKESIAILDQEKLLDTAAGYNAKHKSKRIRDAPRIRFLRPVF